MKNIPEKIRPKEEDYFEFRGKQKIVDYGSCDNYIDAMNDYIDYLENIIKDESNKP